MLSMQNGLDCLCLNEMWLNSTAPSSDFQVLHYTRHRSDWDGGSCKRGGGGLAIYTKNDHKWENVTEWALHTPDIECLWVKLNLRHQVYLCMQFIPISLWLCGKLHHGLEHRLLDIYAAGLADVIIIGDCNLICWKFMIVRSPSIGSLINPIKSPNWLKFRPGWQWQQAPW